MIFNDVQFASRRDCKWYLFSFILHFFFNEMQFTSGRNCKCYIFVILLFSMMFNLHLEVIVSLTFLFCYFQVSSVCIWKACKYYSYYSILLFSIRFSLNLEEILSFTVFVILLFSMRFYLHLEEIASNNFYFILLFSMRFNSPPNVNCFLDFQQQKHPLLHNRTQFIVH